MEIVLTSNGEYINTHRRSTGHCDDRLSDEGIISSLRLAKKLSEETFNFIFCSEIGLRRTTSDLVFEGLTEKNLQIIVDQNLRERSSDPCFNIGKQSFFSGDQTAEESEIINRLFIKTTTVDYSEPSKEESDEQVRMRCKKFLFYLIKHYPSDAKVLVVGNMEYNSYLLALLTGKEGQEKQYLAPHCSISRILYRDSRRKLTEINRVAHLHGA